MAKKTVVKKNAVKKTQEARPDNRQRLSELNKPVKKHIAWMNAGLKALRHSRGMTLDDVAKQMHCSRPRAHDFEQEGNDLRFSTICRLLKVYGKSGSSFFMSMPAWSKLTANEAAVEQIKESLSTASLTKASWQELAELCAANAKSRSAS